MASSDPESPGLARGAIGLREVLFQSVTHMAPAAAVAFSIPAGASFAAGALPLATVLALIACLFVALSIGELARHLPSAGSFYTYASKGIHCLLYTSDAADDLLCVDLGGRRIIKKKTNQIMRM